MTEDWETAISGEILDVRDGTHDTPKYVKQSPHPLITSKNLKDSRIDFSNVKYISNKDFQEIGRRSAVEVNDVLFAMIGTIGNPVVIKEKPNFAIKNVALFKNPGQVINSHLLKYYLKSNVFYDQLNRREFLKGTTQKFIPLGHLRNLKIPLPPLPIQRAIVAKVEQLFSSLDRGIADLKKAQEQLKVYRQAVLKKAFEGGLTRDWRTKQPNLPTSQDLLKQTRQEREEHFNKQLENWKKALQKWKKNSGKGKKPIKPKALKLFDEPVREISLKIPDSWYFDTIGNLSTGVEYGSSAKSLDDGDIPVIRMGNMQGGKIKWDDLKYSKSLDEIKQYSLKSGDVLFNRTNSPELVGKSALYKGERDAIFAGYLIRINHIPSLISSSYLNYFLNSHPAKVYGSFVKTDGVNQSNINGQKLSNYPIPLCSLEEQKEIEQKLDEVLTVCEKINFDISEGLEKAEALRQSILKKAFEGELLSEEEVEKCKKEQDYEPADVLLAKIKAEKKKK